MRLRLIPRESSFYDMFERSTDLLVTGAELLAAMCHNGTAREAIAEQMRDAEHQADDITHAIYREVNSTFVTPFDREDIHRLAHALDEVMDAMEAAVDLIWLYKVTELPAELKDQAELLGQAATLAAMSIPQLRVMKNLQEYFIEANRLENEADKIYRRLLSKLFTDDYAPLTVMKLKDVTDQLEAAADAFEHVAHIVESIAVKES